jgi:hypothetical protein
VIPFIRSLERTGQVRAAAADAGIDHTTAYQRRRAHGDFAAAWERALEAHAAAVRAERAGDFEGVSDGPLSPLSSAESPSPLKGRGEHLVGAGSQLKQAGHDRWNQRKEKAFFEELAATANVKRAAKAAGVSPNAVYARRLRNPHFRAKWAAVLESGRASIQMHLVEAANRSFEPDELDTGEAMPAVSVAEAIRISQAPGSGKGGEALPDPYAEEAAAMSADEVAELRERLVQKLQRLRRRDRAGLLAQGWSYDESWDREIPPGWIKAPDYRPRE